MENRVKKRIRRGFTFVEVLAVAAGFVLLTAITLPAVQLAREDARMEQCRNNLKQLGLAMHNYHDTFKTFPPGWITKRMGGTGHPSTGWQSMILQFIDQAPLYDQLEMVHGVYTGRDLSLLKQSISTYRCPVDPLGGTNALRGGWGTSNYVGNYGAAPIGRWSGSFSNDFWPGQSLTPEMSGQPHMSHPGISEVVRNRVGANQWGIASLGTMPSGLFCMNRGAGLRDITDGASNTFMIGERSVFGGGGLWPGPRSNFHESDVVADASYASPLNGGTPGFSGRHRGVVNFVICDGSVRPINENVDSRPDFGTLQKLAARNDGMRITE